MWAWIGQRRLLRVSYLVCCWLWPIKWDPPLRRRAKLVNKLGRCEREPNPLNREAQYPGRVLSGRLHALGCPGCLAASSPAPVPAPPHISHLSRHDKFTACNCSQLAKLNQRNIHNFISAKSCPFPFPVSETPIRIQLAVQANRQTIVSSAPAPSWPLLRWSWSWRYPAICVSGFLQALEPWHSPGIIQFRFMHWEIFKY